jgi:hypothetical protein
MKGAIAAFVFVFALFLAPVSPVKAGAPAAKPSKESLLAAWEQVQKDSPYTVRFEKTAEKNVYDFETTIFPYSGKIRVENLLIETDPAYFYEFRSYGDEMPNGDYIGIVELELDGIDEKFTRRFSHSYPTWVRDNSLYYHAETKKWYTAEQWTDYKNALTAAKSSATDGKSCVPAAGQERESKPTLFSVFLSWLPFLILISLYVYFMRKSKYAKVLDKNLLHMDKTEKLFEEILEVLKRKA